MNMMISFLLLLGAPLVFGLAGLACRAEGTPVDARMVLNPVARP